MCSLLRSFTLTSLLSAASPFSASQFLNEYEEEFFHVVNAKQSLLKLKHKGVISPDVKTAINDVNDEDAKYILFGHLETNATVDSLREYCSVAIAAKGFPRMQALGRKMMEALPLGGWLLWLCVGAHMCTLCTHACLCQAVYVCACASMRLHTYTYISIKLLQFLNSVA